jgi:excisionase family DNA binding protein
LELDVLTVREAAERLGVSSQRVRQLINDGILPARRSSAGWLVRAQAVTDRARRTRHGRPTNPRTAWAVLDLLSATAAAAQPATVADGVHDSTLASAAQLLVRGLTDEVSEAAQVISDRRLRHRALRLLCEMPDPAEDVDRWRALLASRGPAQRMWAHPGVLQRLERDPRISTGGAEAAASVGEGLSRTNRLDLYVGEPDLKHIISDYRLRPEADGQIILHVVPGSVPNDLAPQRGAAVPVAAAAADLLEEDDPRANNVALRQLRVMRNTLVHDHPALSSRQRQEVAPSHGLGGES